MHFEVTASGAFPVTGDIEIYHCLRSSSATCITLCGYKHIQKAITQTATLSPADLAGLKTGEAFILANEFSDPQITNCPVKIKTRPRVIKHGGTTINATDTQI